MESGKGWTLPQEQICKDKKAVPRQQSSSSPPAVMARDASYNNEPEDEELARKRGELYLVEEQISRKRTNIDLKNNDLQRTPQYREKDDKDVEEDEEWDNEIKASNPAPPSFMKGFVDKRNAEILQRDLEQKRKAQSDLNTTPEHRVEALRPHRHSGQALPSPVSKQSPAEQADPFSLKCSQETLNSGPLLKGFDHFLSVLNQGVDVQRLSDIVNAAQARVVNNKPAAPIRGETCRRVDVDDKNSREKYRESKDKEKGSKRKRKDSRDGNNPSKDKDRQSREEKDMASRGRRSDSRDQHRHSDGRKSRRDSRERDRGRDSRERDRGRDSREKDRGWNSREGDRGWNSRQKDRGWDSREGDRGWDSREGDRGWNSREGDMNSRHRKLESRDDCRDSKDRGSKSKIWDRELGNRDRNVRNKDKDTNDLRQDSLSPRRRCSRDRRSRSRSSSSISLSSEGERKMEKKEHLSRVQTLLKIVGVDLGIEGLDRLNSRTQEMLHGTKHPSGRGDGRQRRRHRETDLTQSVQEVTGSYPVGPAPQNMPVSTFSQPPPTNYSSYTAMYHNSYDGQDHSASVQSWTAVGWSGVPPPGPPCSYGPPLGNILLGTPQFTPPPLMVTGSHNAPYQLPPPQYPPHLGPPPLLPPSSQPPRHLLPPPQSSCQLPPPPHCLPPPCPPLLPPPHLPLRPPPPQPPPHLPPPLLPALPPAPPKRVTAEPNLMVAEMQGSSEKTLTAAGRPPSPQESEPPGESEDDSIDYAVLCRSYKYSKELIVASHPESQAKLTKRELRYLAWRITKKAKKVENKDAVCTCYGYGCRHCSDDVTARPAKRGRTLRARRKMAKERRRWEKWINQKAAPAVAGTATATVVASAGNTVTTDGPPASKANEQQQPGNTQ